MRLRHPRQAVLVAVLAVGLAGLPSLGAVPTSVVTPAIAEVAVVTGVTSTLTRTIEAALPLRTRLVGVTFLGPEPRVDVRFRVGGAWTPWVLAESDSARPVASERARAVPGTEPVWAPDAADRLAQLAAGRLLQRVHLTATDRGLALQPMNQVTERIDRERTVGARPTFAPRFAAFLPAGSQPVIAFRVGHPTRDARPSPRRVLQDVLR